MTWIQQKLIQDELSAYKIKICCSKDTYFKIPNEFYYVSDDVISIINKWAFNNNIDFIYKNKTYDIYTKQYPQNKTNLCDFSWNMYENYNRTKPLTIVDCVEDSLTKEQKKCFRQNSIKKIYKKLQLPNYPKITE